MRRLQEMKNIVGLAALLIAGVSLWAVDRSLILQATTENKADFRIVFRESIDSQDQHDWKDAYKAGVELDHGGKKQVFHGSTLPNFLPAPGKPPDWEYSVVMANCAFPEGLKTRLYS